MSAPIRRGLPDFGGVVLAGGSSRRMGRDKALVELGGRPLAARTVDALVAAGAGPVRVIGGDAAALGALGLDVVADRWPGAGPLGGVLTGLAAVAPGDDDVLVVLSCDLAAIGPDEVVALVEALAATPSADAAAPRWQGRPQLLTSAWRGRAAPGLRAAFDAGERSVRRALATSGLVVTTVSGLDPAHLGDIDTPDDLRAARDGLAT